MFAITLLIPLRRVALLASIWLDPITSPFLEQELFDGDGQLKDYEGGNEITVSPDGRDVYSVASNSDTLVHFKRDQNTGKLRVFKSFQVGATDKPGAAGVAVSPDGKHVYVADETGKAVVIYRHAGG